MVYLYVWSVLQIVLESLPISSSGNVVLGLYFLSNFLRYPSQPIDGLEFDFLLHGPTLIVLGFYFFTPMKNSFKKINMRPLAFIFFWMSVIWADILTGVWYLVFKAVGKSWFPLAGGFLITSFSLLSLYLLRAKKDKKIEDLSVYNATVLGMVQGIALLPGLSRFGLTFVAGRYLGYSSYKSFQYSFLIQTPLLAAAFLKGVYSLYYFKNASQLLHPLFGLIILSSTVVAYYALCFVGYLVQEKKVYYFGYYVFGLALLAAVLGK
jgi:undecaprenyl-diphosphatase